jgi:DNA-binding beta-propeller fold protein YncE
MRATLLSLLLSMATAAALAAPAHARVLLVAAGDANATLVDVSSGRLVARVAVPGRARAVAVAPDGVRGYVAAGAGVAAIDLNGRVTAGDLQLTGTPTALAIGANGARLAAARKGALDIIDPVGLTVMRSADLGAQARRPIAVAVSADSTKAVVALDGKRIAIVDLLGGGVRRIKLPGGPSRRRAAGPMRPPPPRRARRW